MFTHFIQDMRESVFYVFKFESWPKRLWPFLVLIFVPIVGLLNVVLLKGWRFQMVQNIARGIEELPPVDLFSHFKTGVLLWVCTLLYTFVPALFLFATGLGGPISLVSDSSLLVNEGFSSWSAAAVANILVTVTVYLLWFVFSLPTYQAGVIRYALSGKWQAMLNVPANISIVIKYPRYFMKYYFSWVVMLLLILLCNALLAMTVVGVLFIPTLVVCMYYIVTAHELGHLASKITNNLDAARIRKNMGQPRGVVKAGEVDG